MKQHTNTLLKAGFIILGLSSITLAAQARDSLEALRTDLTGLQSRVSAIPAGTPGTNGRDGEAGPAGPAGPQGIAGHSMAAHYIGEPYAGGKVFYVDDSGQHGLIVALADQTLVIDRIRWRIGINRINGTTGDGLYAGAMNTTLIIATQIGDTQEGNFAAKLAADYSVQADGSSPCTVGRDFSQPPVNETCYGDWYMPSKVELNLLYQNKIIAVVGDFSDSNYWSSTEGGSGHAWAQSFSNGNQVNYPKDQALPVRVVRAF